MHSFLSLVSEQLGINAGLAYWVASEISKLYGVEFSTYHELKNLLANNTLDKDKILGITVDGCIYYFDMQETNAWLQSFAYETEANPNKLITLKESYMVFKILCSSI